MPISIAGRTNSRRGVTLIEMVVVVAIAGVIAAISLPSAAAGIDSVRLASATRSISSFLNAAVNRAERRQLPIELVIDPKAGRLALSSNEPGYERELLIADGITIENVFMGSTNPSEDPDNGPRHLLLIPGAATPGIGIQIANKHGSRRIIRLDPMTGYPRVETVTSNSAANQ